MNFLSIKNYLIFNILVFSSISISKINENPLSVEEITVIAEKPQIMKDTTSSITILNKSKLDSSNFESIGKAIKDIAGIHVIEPYGQVTSVFIRGQQSDQLTVLIDGIELNDPSAPGRSADLSGLYPENIAQIEIIRGARSVKYPITGSVIKITTLSGLKDSGKKLFLEAGANNTVRTSLSMFGLGPSKIGYSSSATFYRTDGIPAVVGGKEKTGANSINFALRIDKQLTNNIKANFVSLFSKAKNDLSQPPLDIKDYWTNQQNFLVKGETFFRYKFWRPSLGLSYRKIDRATINKGVIPDTSFITSGTISKLEFNNYFLLNSYHVLNAALQTELQSADICSGINQERVNRSLSTNTFFLEHSYMADSGFFGTIGVRAENQNPVIRISPGYRIPETLTTLTLATGTGFKQPSIYQLYSEYGNPNLNSEKIFMIDFGIEQIITKNQFSIGLTFFYSQLKDLIDFNFSTSRYFNIGKAEIKGIEFITSFSPSKYLSSYTSYTFLDAIDLSSKLQLLRRPKHQISNSFSFFIGNLKLTFLHRFIGSRMDIDVITFKRKEMPFYNIFDFEANYNLTKDTIISARIENIFNTSYQAVDGYNSPGFSAYVGVKKNL